MCQAAETPERQQGRTSVLTRFPGHAKAMLSHGEQAGLKRISPRGRYRYWRWQCPSTEDCCCWQPLSWGRWIRGDRRVLCAGPGGEPDTLAIVDLEPLDHHAQSDRLPEHVAGLASAVPVQENET